ncbi:hypothetical protein EAI30_08725 [Romboutsia ilealis]|nr:hypothetical protein [Romboutsia ilealis]
MRISSEDIKVIVNYPEGYDLNEEIENIKAKWILDQQIETYGKDNISIIYPIWIKIKEIESKGIAYEKAKKIAIMEYFSG